MIFSAVRCNSEGNVGFLENERRTNVALTRAQHGLIIIGNARTLASDPKWETLLVFFKINGVFVEGGLSEAIQRINQLAEPPALPLSLQHPQSWEEATLV